MKRIVLVLAVMFLVANRLPAQQPAATIRPASPITIAVAASWYHPDLGPFNDAYRTLEDARALRPWNHDRIDYAVSVEGRYRVARNQDGVIEAGGTGLYRTRSDDRAYHTIWRFGAGYRIEHTISAFTAFGKVTAGGVWAGFSRSWQSQDVLVNTAKSTWYGSATAGVSYPLISRFSAELGIQYLYVPKFHVTVPSTDINLRGVAVGFGIAMQLP